MLEPTQLSICGWPLLQPMMIQHQIGQPFILVVVIPSLQLLLDIEYIAVVCSFASLMDSQSRTEPLLNSYNDYEDSVYGNRCNL